MPHGHARHQEGLRSCHFMTSGLGLTSGAFLSTWVGSAFTLSENYVTRRLHCLPQLWRNWPCVELSISVQWSVACASSHLLGSFLRIKASSLKEKSLVKAVNWLVEKNGNVWLKNLNFIMLYLCSVVREKDAFECNNYDGLTMCSVPCKVLLPQIKWVEPRT